MFLNRELPKVPYNDMPLVDVKDVAECHLQAFKVPEAAGRRFLCVEKTVFMAEMGQWLSEKKYKD